MSMTAVTLGYLGYFSGVLAGSAVGNVTAKAMGWRVEQSMVVGGIAGGGLGAAAVVGTMLYEDPDIAEDRPLNIKRSEEP